jgi:hypothetical protein
MLFSFENTVIYFILEKYFNFGELLVYRSNLIIGL